MICRMDQRSWTLIRRTAQMTFASSARTAVGFFRHDRSTHLGFKPQVPPELTIFRISLQCLRKFVNSLCHPRPQLWASPPCRSPILLPCPWRQHGKYTENGDEWHCFDQAGPCAASPSHGYTFAIRIPSVNPLCLP